MCDVCYLFVVSYCKPLPPGKNPFAVNKYYITYITCFEAARTTALVNKFLLKMCLRSDAMAELGQFSQHLMHSKVQFTAFGFFNLDCTFIYGFVGEQLHTY
jgi:hypothetical protein